MLIKCVKPIFNPFENSTVCIIHEDSTFFWACLITACSLFLATQESITERGKHPWHTSSLLVLYQKMFCSVLEIKSWFR